MNAGKSAGLLIEGVQSQKAFFLMITLFLLRVTFLWLYSKFNSAILYHADRKNVKRSIKFSIEKKEYKMEKQDLSGVWDFAFQPGTIEDFSVIKIRFSSFASVPGCFDLMPEYFLRRGTGVYRRQVVAGGFQELTSEGIGLRGEIYWDKQKIAVIDAPFSRNIVRFDAGEYGQHELIVAVNNEFDDTPSSLFQRNYDFYAHGGIYRAITLAPADRIFPDELKIIPLDPEKGTVQITVRFNGETENLKQAEIFFDEQRTSSVLPLQNGAGCGIFSVPNPRLWSPETPFLHRAKIVADGSDFTVSFGLRRMEAREGKLYLNGKPIQLIGCNRHDAHPEFGYAVPSEIRLRDLLLLKNAGMNCIRGCHYPQSEDFLDLCDRIGMLVWEESLGWGNSEASLTDPDFQAKQLRETRKMAMKSVNHPSVVLWGFLNEANTTLPSARPLVKSLADALHAVDPSRLITYGSNKLTGDVCLDLADVISFNTYPAWYNGEEQDQFFNGETVRKRLSELADFASRPEYRNKPLLISEIGAEAIPGLLGGYRWSEEYQADLLETVVRYILESDRYSGTLLWQFCDSRTFISNASQSRIGGFNCKGMLDRYRNPKIAWRRIAQVIREYQR